MESHYDLEVNAQETNGLLAKAEYEACVIKDFDINGKSLSGYVFIDCIFEGCNLSLCALSQAAFRNTRFRHCKLLGLRWDDCQPFMFAVHFENCKLDMSSFYAVRLKKAQFIGCSLLEVDFTEADLSEATIDDCDCTGTVFDQTNLTYADFRSARQYIIDPTQNAIKNATFSWPAASGLLVGFGVKVE